MIHAIEGAWTLFWLAVFARTAGCAGKGVGFPPRPAPPNDADRRAGAFRSENL